MSHVNHLARSRTRRSIYKFPFVGGRSSIPSNQTTITTSRVKVQLHLRIVLHAHYCRWLYGPGTVILCDLFIIEAVAADGDDDRTVGGRGGPTD